MFKASICAHKLVAKHVRRLFSCYGVLFKIICTYVRSYVQVLILLIVFYQF